MVPRGATEAAGADTPLRMQTLLCCQTVWQDELCTKISWEINYHEDFHSFVHLFIYFQKLHQSVAEQRVGM